MSHRGGVTPIPMGEERLTGLKPNIPKIKMETCEEKKKY